MAFGGELITASTTVVDIKTGDLQIGAVEIKDGTTDQRAIVTTAGELKVTATTSSGKTIQRAKINKATSGNNAVIAAPGAGLKIKIVHALLFVDATTTITLKTGSTDISGIFNFDPKMGWTYDGETFPLELGTNESFNYDSSAAVQQSGYVVFFSE